MCTMAAGTINLHLRVSTSPFCLVLPNDGTLQQAEVALHCQAPVLIYLALHRGVSLPYGTGGGKL